MKFGTFVFPVATDPANDAVVMQEAIDEALLSEELGMDAVWVAEHHFDGNCVYVDPISFASALTLAPFQLWNGFVKTINKGLRIFAPTVKSSSVTGTAIYYVFSPSFADAECV